jgi:outer membrane protein TolC
LKTQTIYSLCIFLICSINNVSAKENILDDNQITKILVEKNKSIISSKEKLNISDAEIINAGLTPNQNFLLDFSPVQNTYRIGMGHTIEFGNKRDFRIEVANHKKELNKITFLIELRDIKYKALKEFNNVIYLRNKKNKIDELIKISDENLSLTQKKYEAGDIPKLDVSNVELKNFILKNEFVKNLNDLNISENNLSHLLDTNISKTKLIINQKNNICFDILTNNEKFILNNLEFVELSKKQELLNIQEKLYLENIKPNLNLSYGVDTVTDKLFTSESKINLGSFISANIELSTNNKQQGNLYEVNKSRDFLEKEKDKITQNQSLEYINAKENYNSNFVMKKQYEDILLPSIKENLKKAQISFKEGKSNIFSLIIAQQNLIDAELSLINTIHNYQQSIIELKKAGNCL